VNYTDYQGQVRQGLMMPKGFDIQEELTKEPVAFSTPQQVMQFITELTNRRGIVKTLDELLILKTQFNGEGFVLQTPKAKESGGKYFLDEGLIAAAGSDFYSVSDRMEVVIPPERLEQTLAVLMNQRNYTLAAFESKGHRPAVSRRYPADAGEGGGSKHPRFKPSLNHRSSNLRQLAHRLKRQNRVLR
jgi:uncharacterized protein YcgL (UPF0745 family)